MAASRGRGDPAIRIAVLDGPVDLAHPCLRGASIRQDPGVAARPGSPMTAHATHVASIIFGQPGTAMAGLAPRCGGLSIPVFRDGGRACLQVDLARALLRAVAGGAHVINLSGGAASRDGEPEPVLLDALAKCEEAGVLVVAAAGNEGCDCVHVPAAVATVLAVGAADLRGRPLGWSNWGKAYAANGILAPGDDIPGAAPDGGVARGTGTSFAAAFVSGIAGLMLGEQRLSGRTPDPLAVRAALLAGASPPGEHGARGLAGGLNIGGAITRLNRGEPDMNEAINDPGPQAAATAHPGEAGIRPAPEAAASPIRPSAERSARAVLPSDCGCGCGGTCACGEAAAHAHTPQYVYALGRIGFDFGSETRRDSILQFVPRDGDLSPAGLLAYLAREPDEMERIIWTLEMDGTPVYALQPVGANAARGYEKLLAALGEQIADDEKNAAPPQRQEKKTPKQQEKAAPPRSAGLFAIPGVLAGEIGLMSGQTVPVLAMSVRAPIAWDIDAAVEALIAGIEKEAKDASKDEADSLLTRVGNIKDRLPGFLGDFRDLMTRKYRNLGILDRERALNFAATSAVRALQVLDKMEGSELVMDDVTVVPSPAGRPGSACHDVRLRLFERSDTTAPLHIFQFTVDVNDAVPVSIGTVAHWRERPAR